MTVIGVTALLLGLSQWGGEDASAGARLYGRVETSDGGVVEGYLRWDGNEGSLHDFLDGAKEIPREILREAERLDPAFGREMRRRRSLEAFGVRLTWDEDDLSPPPRVPSSIRLARVSEIRILDARRARVVLRDGDEIELHGSTTDIGVSMRGLVVIPVDGPPVTIEWEELERVELRPAPSSSPVEVEPRLFGTLRTVDGLEVTGLVSWDLDEAFPSDVLDGRENGVDRAIPFSDIASIRPVDDRSAQVTLRSGGRLRLSGTNDVDHRNRGIEVVEPDLGRIVVSWADLDEIRFVEGGRVGRVGPPEVAVQGPLRGTVYARDGRVLEGAIRWGHDEDRVWELLDGRMDGAEIGIEMARIREIRPDGDEGALVTLLDGRTLRLHGTDDVGGSHRGIYVTPETGARRFVRWQDLARVTFAG